jgi:hypothetical protein
MAGQNLAASLGVPHPATGQAQGHHGTVDAMLGQAGHLPPALMQSPMHPMLANVAYAAQHGAFAGE